MKSKQYIIKIQGFGSYNKPYWFYISKEPGVIANVESKALTFNNEPEAIRYAEGYVGKDETYNIISI